MAEDKVMIPLGFDLEKGLEEARKIWQSQQTELQKAFNVDVKVKFTIPTDSKLDKLEDVVNRLKEVKLEPITPDTQQAINSLIRELTKLEKILERIDRLNLKNAKSLGTEQAKAALTAQRLAKAKETEAKATEASARARLSDIKAVQQQVIAEDQARLAKLRVIQAEERLTKSRQTHTRTVNTETDALIKQRGVLNGLPQFLNTYISILGGVRLIKNIRDVTAEFELQRVALQAIIQDRQAADDIFQQVLGLAVESPFTARQLIGYTKQLSAYRIETEKLFETTKRLADVSAGLGVDMQRLVLAYGQIRAASYLRGQEVRQLTEAGIPVIELLAEKFTEIEKRAVSTSEVFDKISGRQVPFQYIAEIFEDMTNKGGIFYDMQLKQSKTLYGIIQKLGDAINIAFNQLGEENLAIFKAVGETLVSMARNLTTIVDALTPVVIGFAAYRASLFLVGGGTRELTKAQSLQIISDKERVRSIAMKTSALLGEANASKIAEVATYQYAKAQVAATTSSIGLVRVANRLKAALLRMPIGGLITLLATAGTAIYTIINRSTQATREFDRNTAAIRSNMFVAEQYTRRLSDLARQMKQNNEQINALNSTPANNRSEEDEQRLARLMMERTVLAEKQSDTLKELTERNSEYAKSIKGASDNLEELDDALKEYIRDQQLEIAISSAVNENSAGWWSRNFLGNTNFQDAFQDYNVAYSKWVNAVDQYATKEEQLNERLRLALKNNPRLNGTERQLYEDFLNSTEPFIDKIEAVLAGPSSSRTISLFDGIYNDFLRFRDATNEATRSFNSLWTEINQNKSFQDLRQELEDVQQQLVNLPEDVDPNTIKELERNLQNRIVGLFQNLLNDQGIGAAAQEFFRYQFERATNIPFDLIQRAFVPIEGWMGYLQQYEGNRLGFFNEDQLQDFGTSFNALNQLAKEYKEYQEQVVFYTAQSKSNIKDIAEAGARSAELAGEEADRRYQALKDFGALYLLDKKGGAARKAAQERRQQLEAELSVVRDAYKAYQDLEKIMTQEAAQARINDLYGGVFESFRELAGISPSFSADDMVKTLQTAIKAGQSFLDRKGRLKLNAEISDTSLKNIEDQLKKELDRLGKEISRQNSANKFFESVLGLTGNVGFATDITLRTTGLNLADTRDKLIESLQKTLYTLSDTGEPLEIPVEWTLDTDGDRVSVDFQAVQKVINEMPEKTRANAQSALDALVKYEQDVITSLLNTMSKYDTYEARRQEALRKAEADIAKAQSSALTGEEIDVFINARTKQSGKEIAAITLEEIKNTEDYIKAFEDLDRVGTSTLNDLKNTLVQFLEVSRESLDPSQIREVIRTIESIEDQQFARDPWEGFREGLRQYREQQALYLQEEQNLEQALLDEAAAQERLTEARRLSVEATTAAETLHALWEEEQATEELTNATNRVTAAKDAMKAAENGVVKAQNQMVTSINKAKAGFDQLGGLITDTVALLQNLAEKFGLAFDSETEAAIEAFSTAIGVVSTVMGIMATAAIISAKANTALLATILPLLAASAALAAVFFLLGRRNRDLDKQIAASERRVRALENAYQDLERAIDKALGLKRYSYTADQIENLYKRQSELQRQADIERSKSKKKDLDKIQDLEREVDLINQEIEDLISNLRDEILGGTAQDFAQDLANAMFDALADGSKAALDAWNKTVDEIIANIVKKFLIAKLLEEPIGQLVDQFWNQVFNNPQADILNRNQAEQEIAQLQAELRRLRFWGRDEEANAIQDQINAWQDWIDYLNTSIDEAAANPIDVSSEAVTELRDGLYGLGEWFQDFIEQSGLYDFIYNNDDSNLTGISKGIAGITEDTANTIAAVMNSNLYYAIESRNILFGIHEIMLRWDTTLNGGEGGVGTIPTLLAVQQNALTQLINIRSDTSRIAMATERLADLMDSVSGPTDIRTSPRAINVNS